MRHFELFGEMAVAEEKGGHGNDEAKKAKSTRWADAMKRSDDGGEGSEV